MAENNVKIALLMEAFELGMEKRSRNAAAMGCTQKSHVVKKGVYTEYIVDNGGVCRRHIYAGMNGP